MSAEDLGKALAYLTILCAVAILIGAVVVSIAGAVWVIGQLL